VDGYWKYPTRIGEARIIWRTATQKWRIEIGDEDLGGYDTPEGALDDIVGDHTFSHSLCRDTSTLGLPEELVEWEFVRAS
jgi:hypothetical protein